MLWPYPYSEPLLESFLEPRSVHSADLERGGVREPDRVLAVGVLHELVDDVEVDDVGAVNADELVRVELGFEAAEDLAVQVPASRRVDRHVHTLRLDPPDVAHVDETDAAALLEREPVQVVAANRI